MALKGNIVLPDRVLEGGLVIVEGERIAGVFPGDHSPSLEGMVRHDYSAGYVTPGLIDIHLHGAMGKDVMDGSVEGLREIASHQARCGVTGFVATTLSGPWPRIRDAARSVRAAQAGHLPSEILGLHLEGPFLSLKKRGAHNPEFIVPIDQETMNAALETCGGLKSIITVAPEVGATCGLFGLLETSGCSCRSVTRMRLTSWP
jgi:N-acetylglucosamine-6-phosphate deacetylase